MTGWKSLLIAAGSAAITAALAVVLTFLRTGELPPTAPTAAAKPADAAQPPPDDAVTLMGAGDAPATLTLTGQATLGIDAPLMAAGAEPPPVTVKLGRAPLPAEAKAMIPQLPMRAGLTAADLPVTTGSRRSKAARSLSRMLLNDRLGCCVISDTYHMLPLVSVLDGGPEFDIPDSLVASEYNRLKAGRGDTGCVIVDVLNDYRRRGITDGRGSHPLDGYAACNPHSVDQLKAACYLFGGVRIGVNLPAAWSSSATWDVTTSGLVGGHDVCIVDYDDRGFYVSSWGRIYLLTYRAVQHPRYMSEAYAQIHRPWVGSDRVAPSGVDADKLAADLAVISAGNVPEVTTGPVKPPDGPPNPPSPLSFVIVPESLNEATLREFRAKYPYRSFRLELPLGSTP